jgi:hypothetical protein
MQPHNLAEQLVGEIPAPPMSLVAAVKVEQMGEHRVPWLLLRLDDHRGLGNAAETRRFVGLISTIVGMFSG